MTRHYTELAAGRVVTKRTQTRGVASLTVLMLLLLAMLLVAAWAQRNVLTELRIAANQVRNALAFEAAEAGLAWAQAMLNVGSVVGGDCMPSSAPGGSSFLTQTLGSPDVAGRFTPRTRGNASGPPLQLLCARQATGWACACHGSPSPSPTSADNATVPAFLVQFSSAPQPGTVFLSSTGCNHLARPCLPDASERADATTRLRVSLALLPAIATPPAAALTALGDVDAGAFALGLHNADALSGGLAAHTGGRITATALRVQTAPGAPAAAALLSQDDALSALTPARLFSRHFGIDMSQWMQQPGVKQLDCSGDCSTALTTAIAEYADVARLGVRGDLQLAGSLQIGSAARPVVLVVDGALRLKGPVQIHGLVYADSLRWDDVGEGEGGLLHGAVLLAQGYSGNGAPDLVYDAALMARLKRQSGSWVRLPGSWRDF